jgi:hypothetical protein
VKAERTLSGNETEHRERLQQRLLGLLRRSLASSVGRGLLSIDSLGAGSLMSEALPVPVPHLALCGRTPPSNSLITLDHSNIPPELTNCMCLSLHASH